jgi:(p)ppGpp synthase/HD superfamily hydrolase
MTTHGYSDRVSHAFAFAAKHIPARPGRGSGLSYLVRPANVAVILTRYGCDEHTVVAGILRPLVEETPPQAQTLLQKKVGEKFGAIVLSVLLEVVEPRLDERGKERPWQAIKMDYLANLAAAEPRSLDVCAAGEIHLCGSILTDVRRLGVEYLTTFSKATPEEAVWWYHALAGTLEANQAWPRRAMVEELRTLADQLCDELNGPGFE